MVIIRYQQARHIKYKRSTISTEFHKKKDTQFSRRIFTRADARTHTSRSNTKLEIAVAATTTMILRGKDRSPRAELFGTAPRANKIKKLGTRGTREKQLIENERGREGKT